LLISSFCASAATMAGETALGKQVFDITGRELDLGWLGLLEFAPAFVLVLVAGSVADRFDRRYVVAVAASAEAMVALGLAAYAHAGHHAVAPIFELVLVLGIARAFVSPAERALPADIVPPERLPWLIARSSGTFQVAIIVGPVVGGVLYAIAPAASFIAMAVLLAVAAISIFAVDAPQPYRSTLTQAEQAEPAGNVAAAALTVEHDADETDDGKAGALEGVRFIRSHSIVLGAMALDLFAVLFGGAVALLPAIAETRLGAGAVGLGLLRAAYGIGAALVTACLAFRPVRRRVGRTLLIAVTIFGAATIVLGITHEYFVAFAALAVLAGADSVSVFIRATLVPLATPFRLRGRVLAVENVFIGGSNELGAFESGVAGQILGPGPAVVLGGVATIVIAASWTQLFPDLRRIDSFPEPND
ncbi:MAG TPA: MFS transporter, partial [Acidimicrobiia bacterium]